jgi:DNA (cytosine-5)-methyltransferase 1
VTLVLSLFPGIGLLDRAFEQEGFCVVRGPDLLWGGDIRSFHPPAGAFDGVIGGPPCQAFSGLANFSHRWRHKPTNLIPEYERVVREAAPAWFVMENVPGAPVPVVPPYIVRDRLVSNRALGEAQDRRRRVSFGTNGARAGACLVFEFAALEPFEYARTVTSSHDGGRFRMKGTIESLSVEEGLRRQGCSPDFFGPRSPFRRDAQLKMLAEGVPLPMGRAIARAVRQALGLPLREMTG